MKTGFFRNAILLFSLLALLTACRRSKDGLEQNEEELVTTVRLTAAEVGGGASRVFVFRDIDGPGGAAPQQFDHIMLAPGKTYNFSVELLDETNTPAENITTEVLEEAEDHQFYYLPATVNVSVSGLNRDTQGLPLGSSGIFTTAPPNPGGVCD